ncbi:hypothetical protein EZ428_22875 [Pedobacter frigiditerrae]|uniref:Uncharacterized protein n=1 Tax=Pedobacter frigiditerrae TaxID=2530452 RepID=A0A4V2MHN1_9SPHI|nr:hypothetical protein [Pedobacter frigiditerrae]TCC87046.1 hypothetical protein EZ428_22875 [Pedobacter frigiditerrae]
MEGIIVLSIIYWLTAGVIFLIGLIQLIVKSSKNEPLKPALKLLIISIVMLVIGVGACAAILSGL